MAKYTEKDFCAVLEIPFRLPDWVNDLMAAERWESYSHATDVRKVYAILNAGCAMRRRTGPRAPSRGQGTYQDDVTSITNQYRIQQAAYELVTFFTTVNVSSTHHKANTYASCEEQLRTMLSDPPWLCAYDPDLDEARETWLAKQAYRATIEVSKTYKWTLVDMDHASEGAKRIHLAEVDNFRETLPREFSIVKSHHALAELVHKDISKNRQDLPHITDDAPNIEACMQYVLQSQPAAQLRGHQLTVDAP
ncbi:unnamed protein product, partial [Prorocentrum cordatum]